MARITTLKPKYGSASPRHAASFRPETRDRDRDAQSPQRRWYKTARWQKLRAKVIRRDIERNLGRCAQSGVMLTLEKNKPNSAVVDHIKAPKGNEALFWDEANLQTVTKAWHDSVKQRQERGGGRKSTSPRA